MNNLTIEEIKKYIEQSIKEFLKDATEEIKVEVIRYSQLIAKDAAGNIPKALDGDREAQKNLDDIMSQTVMLAALILQREENMWVKKAASVLGGFVKGLLSMAIEIYRDGAGWQKKNVH